MVHESGHIAGIFARRRGRRRDRPADLGRDADAQRNATPPDSESAGGQASMRSTGSGSTQRWLAHSAVSLDGQARTVLATRSVRCHRSLVHILSFSRRPASRALAVSTILRLAFRRPLSPEPGRSAMFSRTGAMILTPSARSSPPHGRGTQISPVTKDIWRCGRRHLQEHGTRPRWRRRRQTRLHFNVLRDIH